MIFALLGLLSNSSFAQLATGEHDLEAQVQNNQQQPILQNGETLQTAHVPGRAKYLEASSILRTLKAPRRRLARYYKASSLLGSAGYYARQVFALLFMNGPTKDKAPPLSASGPLAMATSLLREASDEGNEDAIFTLAEINLYGTYMHPKNYTAAFGRYQDLAAVQGNSTAQHMLGFIHATGLGGSVPKDQARALLYHTYAADAGDVRSQMTVGYRHHAGIATPRNCERAVTYYKLVADQAMAWKHSGPPGGQSLFKEAHRLADETGGVYGDGASVSSSGPNAKQTGPTHDVNAAFDDVLEYLDLMSRKGELKAIFNLGRLHYDGSRALEQNNRIAADKFFDVARRYWDKNGKIRPDTEPGVDRLASRAAGYLGRMFLRGDGLEQNYGIAKVWFQRGIQNGDPLSQYSMGMMHLQGYGVEKNAVRAADFFGAAADEDFAPAQVRLGALLMDQGDLSNAIKYFELAARTEHIEAFYYLAELANQGGSRNCNQAALYYKKVAEKAEPVHSNFGEANDAHEEGDFETALLLNMMGAEQGYEAAQANVAYLLDRFVVQPSSQISRFFSGFVPDALNIVSFRLPFLSLLSGKSPTKLFGDATLALIYWTRSAKGGNIDSLVKLGDYYLAGLGVPQSKPQITMRNVSDAPVQQRNKTNINENYAKAAACYSAASDTLQSAQAYFNLGWMHENGIGLEQDFHLAKRYYDAATEPPMKEAKAPVALALFKLRLRGWWDWLKGGSINQIRDTSSEEITKPKKRKTFYQWLGEFITADMDLNEELLAHAEEREGAGGYMNEWGESLNGGYNGEDWEDLGSGLTETLIIIGLAGCLAFLVWYRQMVNMRERARREREQHRHAVANQPEGPSHPFTSARSSSQSVPAAQSSSQLGPSSTAAGVAPTSSSAFSTSQQPRPTPTTSSSDTPSTTQQSSSESDSNGWSFNDVPSDQQPGPSNASSHDPAAPGGNWSSGPGGIGH